jgi:hypothetical protein
VEDKFDGWKRFAERRNVPIHSALMPLQKSISETVLTYAKKHHINLIALETESGSLSQLIVRKATCPVWLSRASTILPEEKAA